MQDVLLAAVDDACGRSGASAWSTRAVRSAHASQRTDVAEAERDDFAAQARHRVGAAVHDVQLLGARQQRAAAAILRRS